MNHDTHTKKLLLLTAIMIMSLMAEDSREQIIFPRKNQRYPLDRRNIEKTPFLSLDHDYAYVWCKMRNAAIIDFGENTMFQEKKIPAALTVKENDTVLIPISMNFRITINGTLVFYSKLSKEFRNNSSCYFVEYIRTHDTRVSDPINGCLFEEVWFRSYPRDRYLATSASMPILNGKELAPKPKE